MSAAIVALARDWIGTPYCHQAATKGAGCDCLGLVRGIWAAQVGDLPETVPAYSPDWSEPQGEEALLRAAGRHLKQCDLAAMAPGHVVLFRLRQSAVAKHLGIIGQLGTEASFIHAYSGHGVVESPLTTAWARRIVACFAFPERSL